MAWSSSTLLVPLISVAYLALLFAIAAWGDRANAAGRRLGGPWTYALSLAVYCTAWTFFGSVGSATTTGLSFLPIYLGPTIAMFLSLFVLKKMLRIAKLYGITSIADLVAARYGKSARLAALAASLALVGLVPYIAVQLKSIAMSMEALLRADRGALALPYGNDTALYVTLALALFSILFGTRQIDVTEQHQGITLAIAFESVVKLLIFLAIGIFVVFVLYDGPSDLLGQAVAAGLEPLLTFAGTGLSAADWFLLCLISGLAFLFLPRQFQVAVIENQDPAHLDRASWAFPAYLILINLFVLPIALASVLHGLPNGDLAVVELPIEAGVRPLAVLTFLGGLSAATAMVIVETVALSTMVSNDIMVPLMLRLRWFNRAARDRIGLVLAIRRIAILVVLGVAYLFFRVAGSRHQLAGLGMISFCAAAQFGPPILVGLYWRGANRMGALAGLVLGFGAWIYTLLLPSFAPSSLLSEGFVTDGPYGIGMLAPNGLFGMTGMNPIAHAAFWSLSLNLLGLVLGSLLTRSGSLDRLQAQAFVDVWTQGEATRPWQGVVRLGELRGMLERFIGPERTATLLAADARRQGLASPSENLVADARLVQTAERQLARALGASSARVLMSSVVKREVIGPQEVMTILDETSQAIRYSRELERKSLELERATAELRAANDQLRQLDRLKDDFMATVSHELRTPLTSIRAFSEILRDAPELAAEERERFLAVIVKEAERLTRLIDDILDLAKLEAGGMEWRMAVFELAPLVEEVAAAMGSITAERRLDLDVRLEDRRVLVHADRDRLFQVLLNLLGNAAKFVRPDSGRIRLGLRLDGPVALLTVEDDGPGIPDEARERIFERFHQLGDGLSDKPKGTGLGLAISRQIIGAFGGRITAGRSSLGGALFTIELARAEAPDDEARPHAALGSEPA